VVRRRFTSTTTHHSNDASLKRHSESNPLHIMGSEQGSRTFWW